MLTLGRALALWAIWPEHPSSRGAGAHLQECDCRNVPCRPALVCERIGRKIMEWFSQKTSIAGIQIPNWGIVLGAAIVVLLIYTSMH